MPRDFRGTSVFLVVCVTNKGMFRGTLPFFALCVTKKRWHTAIVPRVDAYMESVPELKGISHLRYADPPSSGYLRRARIGKARRMSGGFPDCLCPACSLKGGHRGTKAMYHEISVAHLLF